jgi:hypothetical protein
VNGNSTLRVGVEAGGSQVVAHAGLHALGRFADRIGLASSLSAAIPWSGERACGRSVNVAFGDHRISR